MNRIKTAALLPILCLVLAGCATRNAPPRFHESSKANAVLQFSSWEYTFLLRPRYDENGFLLQVPREHIADVFDKVNLQQRDLAVVVIGWNRTPAELQQLSADWNAILRGCGFRRVVLVKSSGTKQLNGSYIIDDSDASTKTARTAPQPGSHAQAPIAPAAGANAENSSGDSVGKISERVATGN